MHFIFKTFLIGKEKCDYWLIHFEYLVQIKVWTDVFNSAYYFLPDISLPYFPRSKLVLLKITRISMSLHPLHCEWFLQHFTDGFTISSPWSSGIHLFPWCFKDVVTISLRLLPTAFNGSFDIWHMVSLAVPSLHHHNLCTQSQTKTAATTDVLTQLSEGICFKTFTGLLKKSISWIFFLQSVWDVMDYGLADFSISPKFWETRGWGILTSSWRLSKP